MVVFAKTHKFIRLFTRVLIVVWIISSCYKINPATVVPVSTLTTPTDANKKVIGQVVVSDWSMNSEFGEDFGWLPDGRVYYGMRDKDGITWLVYDPSNSTTSELDNPGPNLTPEAYQLITEGGQIAVTAFTTSPSRDVILYTRVPLNYVEPKTPEADHFDPQELWMLHKGEKPVLLAEEFAFDCGILAPWSNWLNNESVVFGTCLPYYGIESFFVADVSDHVVRYYDWVTTPNGETDSISIANIAHGSPRLAFKTYGLDGLWTISIDDKQEQMTIDMESASLLTKDDVIAPLWSYDDQWIYYWQAGEVAEYDQNGFPVYSPWWLERINVNTAGAATILSVDDLRSAMGDQMYETYGGYQWRLSPNERQILLLRSGTLFLISW